MAIKKRKSAIKFIIFKTKLSALSACASSQYSTKLDNGENLPQFIVDFFQAFKEETNPEPKKMADKCSAHFSLVNLSEKFVRCATTENKVEVDMDACLEAWHELIRFLNAMGKAFSFVSSDVVSKVEILEGFRKSEAKENYETVEKMMAYEKKENLINYEEAPSSKVKASGSRTLLRLHRALKFLLLFLEKLAKNEEDGKVSLMGYKAYHASPMAKYHPWIVRKAVGIAVYMLPDREKFIKQLCQDLTEEELVKTTLTTSESMDAVYEYTQALYSKYELSEIP
ncbi:ceramide-1-phosphate transfer protein-like isoform X2 [Styela clava]